jgi:hypothetical protein
MSNKSCPGSIGLKQAKPEELPCPNCHHMVEIWSDELRRRCGNCGTVVTRELGNSCILWCSAAKECIGEQLYNRLMSERQAVKEGVR